jgi:hypothetical protein
VDFGDALDRFWAGYRMRRRSWRSPAMFVALSRRDLAGSGMTPYLYIRTEHDHRAPYVAPSSDLLADDWVIADVGNAER